MSLRQEFVTLALASEANRRELCRRFGISPKTGYKWLRRYQQAQAAANPSTPEAAGQRQNMALAALHDQSRRPHRSPRRTSPEREAEVVALRQAHPVWGGRTLARRLDDLHQSCGDPGGPPKLCPSTVTGILHRHGLITAAASRQATAWHRFEHERPNQLWQMDFKGDFSLNGSATGPRCYPLTVLDDHSRFALCLQACPDMRMGTVQARLQAVFGRYGLPERMTMDNGAPWGAMALADGAALAPGDGLEGLSLEPCVGYGGYTQLVLWLLRLGIRVSHSRPYHPQTQGKDERFHRTVKAELLAGQLFFTNEAAQPPFDQWRDVYNLERPHQALQMTTPASRYYPSPRQYPAVLPDIRSTYYGPDDEVRQVQQGGLISFRGREWKVGKAFSGHPVALRPQPQDGLWKVVFCAQPVRQLDLIELSSTRPDRAWCGPHSHGASS